MTSTTTQTLVATAPDGVEVTYRTRAEYHYAGLIRGSDGQWFLGAKGWSQESVRSRTHTLAGYATYVVVPFKVKVQSVAETEVPEAIAKHFASKREQAGSPARQTPQIAEYFIPGKGWLRCTTYVRATFTEIRAMATQGVTTVGVVAYDSPVADFPVEPMLRKASFPLLGGGLVGSPVRKGR